MANYSVLKAAVAAVVKTNGNQEITGANMQSTLISIINSLGTGYQFMGVATPSTSPGTPDYNVAYIGGAGTYANFGTSITVPVGSICIFKYNGSWAKEQIALFAGIDDVPTANSNNLVKSGGVYMDNINSMLLSFQMALSYSKNLYNPNDTDAINGKYLTSTGALADSSAYSVSGFIPFVSGSLVSSINGIKQTTGGACICLYDYNKNLLFSDTIANLQGTATWQQGVSYARFSFTTATENRQVEVGTTASDYMPYGVIRTDKLPLDNSLSLNSDNPVKNNVITTALGDKVGFSEIEKKSSLTWAGGFADESGITQRYGLFHGEYEAKIGDRIVVTMPYALERVIPAVLRKNANNTYTTLLSLPSDYTAYEYVVTENETICINFRNGTATFDGSTGVSVKSPSVYDIFNQMSTNFVSLENGRNLANPSEFISGYYFDATGVLYQNSSYAITGYIPFTQEMGKLILSINGSVSALGSAYHCVYNENKQFVRSYKISTLAGEPIAWQTGDAFIRFSLAVSSVQDADIQVEAGQFPTEFIPYGEYIDGEQIEKEQEQQNIFSSFRDASQLANGISLTLPLTYVRDNLVLSAMISGTLESVDLGQGDGIYNGGHITITSQNIIIGSVTTPHGLTLTGRTAIIMSRGENGKVTIISSNGGMFSIPISSSMGGAPYLKNNGSTDLDVELSFMPKNITKKIWLIGDSYLSIDIARWPYWVKEMGFENYMIDNLSGGASQTMLQAFENDLTIGCPQYAFWGLGMNDGTDTNADYFGLWKMRAIRFITDCNTYGITPIMATVPSVPNISNENRNAWVRSCGCRFIDFAKAVNAQPNGTWDAGLISSDNVHPSEAGAKVLASRVLIDFPEIANND